MSGALPSFIYVPQMSTLYMSGTRMEQWSNAGSQNVRRENLPPWLQFNYRCDALHTQISWPAQRLPVHLHSRMCATVCTGGF